MDSSHHRTLELGVALAEEAHAVGVRPWRRGHAATHAVHLKALLLLVVDLGAEGVGDDGGGGGSDGARDRPGAGAPDAGAGPAAHIVPGTARARARIGQRQAHAAKAGLQDALKGRDTGGKDARQLLKDSIGRDGEADREEFFKQQRRVVKLLHLHCLKDRLGRREEAEAHEDVDENALA